MGHINPSIEKRAVEDEINSEITNIDAEIENLYDKLGGKSGRLATRVLSQIRDLKKAKDRITKLLLRIQNLETK